MVIIVSIIAVVILAGFFAFIKLTPHKGAGSAEKPHPSHSGPVHLDETRSPGIN